MTDGGATPEEPMPAGVLGVLRSRGPEETERFASLLGRRAVPGLVIALNGDLGAGKTAFTRGLADGLDLDSRQRVGSPTFVLIHEYDGRLPIYHFDTYRLNDPDAFVDLGIDEYFQGPGVSVIEWADRFRELLPADRLAVRIDHAGPAERHLTVQCVGHRFRDLASAWLADCRASVAS